MRRHGYRQTRSDSTMTERTAQVTRNTRETRITVSVNLDGTGVCSFDTGVPFLEHMMEQVARHGIMDIQITAQGDLHIDDHHTVEDIGITFGQAVLRALGDKQGISRYGHAYVPLDEALSRVVIDFSGRPLLVSHATYPDRNIGTFSIALIHEFFQGFCNHALATLHMDSLRGENAHHIAETLFKAFGQALRRAVALDDRVQGVPSTKGVL